MTDQELITWLNEEPSEIEYTDDAKPAAYIPIWAVENYLDTFTDNSWERYEHQYTFINHPVSDLMFLSTSHVLKVRNRVILCSSCISLVDYPDATNILQTGIAEATKAGVKVLGRKFGKYLNERAVLKPKDKPEKIRRKAQPDAQIMKAYLKAVNEKDTETVTRLSSIYHIKVEEPVNAT